MQTNHPRSTPASLARASRQSHVPTFPFYALLALTLALAVAPTPAVAAAPPAPQPGKIVIGPPQPVDPYRLERMRAWHPRYRAAMRPVRRALGAVLEHPGPAISPRFLGKCMELQDALESVDRRALLPAPDFAVSRHIRRALFELDEAASSCIAEADRTMRYRLGKADEAFGNAALALAPYRLRP